MNWFKCDDSGNVVVDMNNVLLTINNTAIPQIKQNQADILQAIQNITASGGGLNADQLNQILTILTTIYSSLDFEVTGILNVGETSITITDENIKEDTSMTVFTSIYGVSPLTIVTVDGSVTLTFPPQTDDMGVRVSFKRPVDWDNISGGSAQQPYTVTIDGVEIDNDLNLITVNMSSGEIVSILPYNCDSSSIIVYDNEIHLLGGREPTKHYKWNGTDWVNVSTLPYEFYNGSTVIYNNEIHILGGNTNNGGATKHYKWNGSEWLSVSALPYEFDGGSAVVCNNEIHILGGGVGTAKTKHYKWNGSEWVNVSTLPYEFYGGDVLVYNNEIHLLGGNISNGCATKHYKWNGSEWVNVSALPYEFYLGSAVVLNNEIHLLGGNISNGCATKHYKWDGSNWVSALTLPYEFNCGSAVVLNNEIHLLGCATDTETNHVKLNSDNSITYKKIN